MPTVCRLQLALDEAPEHQQQQPRGTLGKRKRAPASDGREEASGGDDPAPKK